MVGYRCNSFWIARQSGTCYFGGDFGWSFFLPIQAVFAKKEQACDIGILLLSPNKFTQGYLLKIEWLVTNETAVGSLDIAEHVILWVIFPAHFFGQFRPLLWSGSNSVI